MAFLAIIDRRIFTTSLAYLDQHWSAEVDWDASGMDTPFLGYDFWTGSVDGVPTALFPGHCMRLDGLGNEINICGLRTVSEKWFHWETTTKDV